MKSFYWNIVFFFLFASNAVNASDYFLLADLNSQIKNYKDDISKFDNLILQNNALLVSLNQNLKKLSDELSKLADLLKTVEIKTKDKSDYLILKEAEIDSQKTKLERLRTSYKNKVVWLYKYGAEFPMIFLYTSGSFNQFYIRLQYLNRLTNNRTKDFDRIKNLSYIFDEKRKLEGFSTKDKLKYVGDKKETQKEILQEKLLTEIRIDSIKNLNNILERQISNYSNKISEINKRISSGVPLGKYVIYSKPEYPPASNFEALKGLLIFPVNSIFIRFDFGKSLSLLTKTISYNNGIDFEISAGSEVRCIADGTVDNIYFVPAFGNVIVIRHDSKYQTTYSILSSLNIKRGQIVKAGDVIAKTGSNIDGQMFHFEIFENNIPVDPKLYLK